MRGERVDIPMMPAGPDPTTITSQVLLYHADSDEDDEDDEDDEANEDEAIVVKDCEMVDGRRVWP